MQSFTAFHHARQIAKGPRAAIVAALRSRPAAATASDILIFDDSTGRQIDFDLRGEDPIDEAPATRTRGRPNLGVVAREVTLLPRHWAWLGGQPGGVSAVLRRLVDEAHKRDGGQRAGKDAAYRFLTAMAGNRAHYEEAIRALFADKRNSFEQQMARWPRDIREHALALAYGTAATGELAP